MMVWHKTVARALELLETMVLQQREIIALLKAKAPHG